MTKIDQVLAIPGNERTVRLAADWMKSRVPIAFVGAGASAELYPLWTRLIDLFAEAAVEHGLATPADAAYWKSMAAAQPTTVALSIRRRLGDGLFHSLLRKKFGYQPGRPRYTATHELLMHLPFTSFVTTNYDPGLIEARRAVRSDVLSTSYGTWADTTTISGWRSRDIFREAHSCPILYLHGIYDRPEQIVLDEDRYLLAYNDSNLIAAIQNLWTQENLVFVGFSFNDVWFEFIAKSVLASRGARIDAEPRHIAILATPADAVYSQEQRRMYLDRFGAEVIFYPVRTNADNSQDHSGLNAILRHLQNGRIHPINVATSPGVARPTQLWVPHLPDPPSHYVANATVSDQLSTWASDKDVKVISIYGEAGIGKTTAVHHWAQYDPPRHASNRGVFAWSFNANRDQSQFFREIGRFLERSDPFWEPTDSVDGIARRVAGLGVLVIIDGLEEVSASTAWRETDPEYGTDSLPGDLTTLLLELRFGQSLAVITSRFPLRILETALGSSARSMIMPALSDESGAAVLSRLAPTWPEADRKLLSARLGGNPLALNLINSNIGLQNQIGELQSPSLSSTDAILEHLYSTLPARERDVVGAVSLFDQPVSEGVLQSIVSSPESVSPLSTSELQTLLGSLRSRSLVEYHQDSLGRGEWTTHRLVREFFRIKALQIEGLAGRAINSLSSDTWVSSKRGLLRCTNLINLLLKSGQTSAADQVYRQRLRNGQLFMTMPAVRDGLECAEHFVKSPERRQGVINSLSRDRAATYLNHAGLFAHNCAELTLANRYHLLSLRMSEEESDWKGMSYTLLNRSETMGDLGLLDGAELAATAAGEYAATAGSNFLCRVAASFKASVLLRRGQFDAAAAGWREACAMNSVAGTLRSPEGFSGVLLGAAFASVGLAGAALEIARQIREKSEDHPHSGDMALAGWVSGSGARMKGDLSAARVHLAEAAEILTAGEQFLDLARVKLSLAEVELEDGNLGVARSLVEGLAPIIEGKKLVPLGLRMGLLRSKLAGDNLDVARGLANSSLALAVDCGDFEAELGLRGRLQEVIPVSSAEYEENRALQSSMLLRQASGKSLFLSLARDLNLQMSV